MVEQAAIRRYEAKGQLTLPIVRATLRSWLDGQRHIADIYDGIKEVPPRVAQAGDVLRFLIGSVDIVIADPGATFVNSDPTEPLGRFILSDGSLSYPLASVVAKTDAEDAGVGEGGDLAGEVERLERRVEEVEAQRDELMMVVEMHRFLSDTALARQAKHAEDVLLARGGE